jgi:hypothetical protein
MTGQFLPRVPTRLDQRWPILAVRGASLPAWKAGITCLIHSMSTNIEEKGIIQRKKSVSLFEITPWEKQKSFLCEVMIFIIFLKKLEHVIM